MMIKLIQYLCLLFLITSTQADCSGGSIPHVCYSNRYIGRIINICDDNTDPNPYYSYGKDWGDILLDSGEWEEVPDYEDYEDNDAYEMIVVIQPVDYSILVGGQMHYFYAGAWGHIAFVKEMDIIDSENLNLTIEGAYQFGSGALWTNMLCTNVKTTSFVLRYPHSKFKFYRKIAAE
eukprot:TRINITY_DN6347_c0_g1_i1.p1 TRINITY_DN6347_c0_g1~~TRINITY_DN6347_c0_g1_i1.p1  ORF type:complete len:177 (-),score=32.45 TRINITY_DN6347_c0_g1_i1:13-543(-)